MKVNLNIEEDDMFRQHVKSLIEGQVRHVLREQLSGIVAGEIAKLRLFLAMVASVRPWKALPKVMIS